MRSDAVIRYYTACKDQVDEETSDIRKIWNECLDQYMCQMNFGEKKKWQSKRYVPISKPKIKRAVRLIKKIMLGSQRYFDFEHPGDNPEKKKQCNITRRGLRVHLNAARFLDTFAETLESGFTMAMMIMKWWVGDSEDHFNIDTTTDEVVWKTRTKLKCKAINPLNFRFSRDGQIVIEDEWISLPDLKEMATEKNGEGKFIYDQAQIKKLIKGDYGDPKKLDEKEEQRLNKIGIRKKENEYRKDVLLSHFWGPLIDRENNIDKKNCRFIVANDKFLILLPQGNPFWHKKPPYVYASPLNVLFRHIGKGLTEDVRGIENAIVTFVNLQLDNLLWQMLGVREVDPMALDETGRSDMRELYPGKLVRRRTGYQGQAFKYHELGVAPEKAMPMLQELKLFMDGEHGVTEYVEAMQGRASENATVYSGKRAAAMTDFQSIATDIERGFMVDCIDMARDLMVQYLADFNSSPNMTEIFWKEGMILDGLTESQRREMIVTDLDIIGRGVSIFFDRMEKIEKMGSFVKMINALPDDAKLYVPWPDLIKQVFEAFAFDKLQLLTDDQVAKLKAEFANAQNRQMMMAVQQFMATQKLERDKQDKDIQFKLKELQHETEENRKDRQHKVAIELMKD